MCMDPTPKLPYYRQSAQEVTDELHSQASGITHAEASKRLQVNGPNRLFRVKHESVVTTFFRQFKNILVLMLLISAAFSIYLHDAKTATILLVITSINTVIGFLQEHKAETLMKELEQLMVPQAKVLRAGKLHQIDSTELVLGDVVYIESGDSVPADLRILEEAELSTNDFALTGESNPSRKFVHAMQGDVPLANRHNLVFMGTTVANGTGFGIVVATAMHTELGRIAALSQAVHTEASPLQKEMANLTTRIAQITVVLAVLLVLIAIHAQLGLHNAILLGIGIGAAMIPSGLVAEVNITLAAAANRLAKAKALVKRLSAVETLGATNYILTDKTGTLTRNEMMVQAMVIGRNHYTVSGSGYGSEGRIAQVGHKAALGAKQLTALELFFQTAGLASNATISPPDEDHPNYYVVGDPTEGALISLAGKAGINLETLGASLPEVKEFQFDSARKLMSSVRLQDGRLVVFLKGAPEEVLARSQQLWDHGHVRKLTTADRSYFSAYDAEQAQKSLRNLAFGYRVLPADTKPDQLVMEDVEQQLTFLGIASMADPLRDSVPQAMRAARGAHIKVSIITGDSAITAKAIAEQAQLAPEITVITGDELPGLADSQIAQLIERGGAVFSRVSPEGKLRIVEIVKNGGHVVAVTGDGINDAPALKRADIGVAMGKTGSDVSKDAAEIILLDDSFNTLISAVEQGRVTYQNIKKAAHCALTANFSELSVVLLSLGALSIYHVPSALPAIQILAIDIVAQILPIIALGWDKPARNMMHQKPRDRREHIINLQAVSGFAGFGVLAALLSYGNYLFFFLRESLSPVSIDTANPLYHEATTVTYLTLALCLYVYLLFERADNHENFFSEYLWSNKKLLGAFAISFVLIACIIYTPFSNTYFATRALGLVDWVTALAAAGLFFCLRFSHRYTRKHSRKAVLELHRQVHGQA
ncbi:MAG: P-type superfamily ATPase, Ca2+-transporting ATPase [Candidatus Saccharibacteria bacterium]|nr:P-type superfamily ATPase, Ca2+-transporting ATPase [Candidatus Saccharibacteria bacterium]